MCEPPGGSRRARSGGKRAVIENQFLVIPSGCQADIVGSNGNRVDCSSVAACVSDERVGEGNVPNSKAAIPAGCYELRRVVEPPGIVHALVSTINKAVHLRGVSD